MNDGDELWHFLVAEILPRSGRLSKTFVGELKHRAGRRSVQRRVASGSSGRRFQIWCRWPALSAVMVLVWSRLGIRES